ncbi:MAG: murein biosynthesis integral membrane protein MurJ, partial [Candidatus Falkowbacteria bacterium]|nr:murein biosynthesis integral membrane protein MurJ [Candidatus Falkowbacteria bacterium]
MVKKLINAQISSITIAAFLLGTTSLISRLLGVFRDRILAGQFGVGDELDIYFAAFRIPDLVYNLIILGALSAGFIPIFTELLQKKDAKSCEIITKGSHQVAWEFVNNLVNILIVIVLTISVLGFIFAPSLMRLITPGFNQQKINTTVELTRIMFLSPLILGLSGIASGALQSFKRFFAFSLSPIMYNLGIIIGALFFVPIWGINGLAYGVVFGALLHLLVQMPALLSLGYKYRFYINWKSNKIKRIGSLMIPRIMSLATLQINLVITTVMASTLASGSLTIFNLANNLQSFPIGIFGISFAIAAFPALAVNVTDQKKFIEIFSRTIRNILFFIVPATVIILTLKAQIIRIVLGSGQFNWNDTISTYKTLELFSLSLFAQAVAPLLTRMFFAKEDSKTPFFIGLISALINIALSYFFAKKYGVSGLALAFSVSSIINFTLLWVVLRVRIGSLDEKRILSSVIKFSSASVGCGVVIQGME